MLILSRKAGEGLVLVCPDGTTIDVVVTDIRKVGTSRPVCKIGVNAPNVVRIRRDDDAERQVIAERNETTGDQ